MGGCTTSSPVRSQRMLLKKGTKSFHKKKLFKIDLSHHHAFAQMIEKIMIRFDLNSLAPDAHVLVVAVPERHGRD